ncbi:Omp28-related outer membrane protein [bacterium]|nr:Omp28-related outer membrane protein [bacterium]
MRQKSFVSGMFLVLLALCFTVSTTAAVERCVLVELFTWTICHSCPEAEAALDSLTQEYPDSSLAIIRYHCVPAPSDTLYKPESQDRWTSYYGQSSVSRTFFDGGMMVAGADDSSYYDFKDSVEVRRAIPSPLSMSLSVTYDTTSRSGQVFAQVIAVDSVEEEDLYLRYALIESEAIHIAEVYQEVLRDMIPDAQGVSFAIDQGETFNDTMDFTIDPLWFPENCDMVVFVQDDDTKEVLQSVQTWIPLFQVPAPVEDLKVTLSDSHLYLDWSPVTKDKNGHPLLVDYYRVFRDTSRYCIPGAKALIDSTAELFYLDTSCGKVGDTQNNCYYYVTAMAGGLESDPSNEVGEFDFYVPNVK